MVIGKQAARDLLTVANEVLDTDYAGFRRTQPDNFVKSIILRFLVSYQLHFYSKDDMVQVLKDHKKLLDEREESLPEHEKNEEWDSRKAILIIALLMCSEKYSSAYQDWAGAEQLMRAKEKTLSMEVEGLLREVEGVNTPVRLLPFRRRQQATIVTNDREKTLVALRKVKEKASQTP